LRLKLTILLWQFSRDFTRNYFTLLQGNRYPLWVGTSRDKMTGMRKTEKNGRRFTQNSQILIGLLLVLATITACTAAEPQTSPESPTVTEPTATLADSTETVVPPGPTLTQIPSATASTDLPPPATLNLTTHYTLTATLDFGWRYLEVTQQIAYPNTATETINDLTLVVQSNWRSGAFKLTELALNAQPITDYTLETIQLHTSLPQPLAPGEYLDIAISYEIAIPPILTSEDFGPNPFGYTIRQMNLTDWYPFVPPYVAGEGWLVHNPWFYGEHLVYPAADFDVTLELINAPEGTVIATSALDQGDGNIHHYQLEQARNFVMSISPEYQIRRERVGDTLVLGYSYAIDDYPALGAFNATIAALKLFNKYFGPYPYESLSVIEADFNHGMEYTGLFYLSKAFYNQYNGEPGNFLVTIAAHETAHQWWYGLVGNDQALEPWLDEALCTYSEKLFYEKVYPDDLKWWWDVRVNYYQPTGFIDKTIYDTPGYLPYRDAVYLNGGKFFHQLRKLIGDEAFFAFLQDFIQQSKGEIATTEDFFTVLATHTQVDLTPLVGEYFQSPVVK
jgi:hypothetical protein